MHYKTELSSMSSNDNDNAASASTLIFFFKKKDQLIVCPSQSFIFAAQCKSQALSLLAVLVSEFR